MKIKKINNYFRKIAEFQLNNRLLFIVIALILTTAGISGINRITMTNDRAGWFEDSEAIEIATDTFEKQFGNNDTIGILVEADDVFHPEVLKAIKKLGDELKAQVPYADDVTSLMDLEVSIGTREGIKIVNPFKDGIPEDPKKLAVIKKLILSRKSLAGKLVSTDSTQSWITLELKEYPEPAEWKKKTNKDPMFQVGEAAIKIVTNPKWKSKYYTLKPAGMPYSETEERDFFSREGKIRVLTSLILMIVLLILFTRSFTGVLVPIFTTIMGIIVVFGIMGWLGIGIDANMVTLPVILGMALSVGYSIHLVNAFTRFFRQTGKRKASMISAVEETGWPIFFTALTTIGSVMSFATTGIITIKWVGFTSAAVVLVDYLFVIILIPVIMSFGRDKDVAPEKENTHTFSERLLERTGLFVLQRKGALLIATTLIFAALIPGVFKITTNIDIFTFMGLKVPYVKRLYEVSQSQLGSYLTYNITINYDKPGAIKDPEIMKNFDDLVKTIGNFELTKKNKDASTVFSILDIIKDMNQTLHNDDPAYYRVPESRKLIAQLLFLYELSGGTKTFNWIDEDYKVLRAQVRISEFSSGEIVREVAAIDKIVKEKFPGATMSLVGSAMQFAELNKKIVTGELKSLTAALITIGILLIIVFSSVKTGLIGMIPNFTPLIVLGSIMGYLHSPLDMMTMTIMPMLLGIAVDDTIHFINHIKYEFEKTGHYETAILRSFKNIGKTLAMTTIILSSTFATYMLSPVNNMFRLGVLASIGLTAALIIDFIVTPSLVALTHPFGKESVVDEDKDEIPEGLNTTNE